MLFVSRGEGLKWELVLVLSLEGDLPCPASCSQLEALPEGTMGRSPSQSVPARPAGETLQLELPPTCVGEDLDLEKPRLFTSGSMTGAEAMATLGRAGHTGQVMMQSPWLEPPIPVAPVTGSGTARPQPVPRRTRPGRA